MKKKKSRKSAGGMSRSIIDVSESATAFVNSPRAVLVTPAGEIDRNYDEKTKKLMEKRDKRAGVLEAQALLDSTASSVQGVKSFVRESLNGQQVRRTFFSNLSFFLFLFFFLFSSHCYATIYIFIYI